ncbi:MAG: hypothetical protein ACLFRB_06810 [Thiohalorhabdus sp.]|uniref:phage adaptor protein n=1 Tax=Thiohalorhabdus sp. TaxID=3094134 RepID=UPI003980E970
MAGMDEASLVADLKASLHDAGSVFADDDSDFQRHLALAALDLGRKVPRILSSELALEADVAVYDAPSDLIRPVSHRWGAAAIRRRNPWDRGWPGRLPRLTAEGDAAEGRVLVLIPPPTADQITALGAALPYTYRAVHQVGDAEADTTVQPAHRGLLLLRAQAEAMKELAARNIAKPVQLRDGQGGAPKNGVPASLHAQLMDAFERGAA